MANFLIGSWALESRVDRNAAGEIRPEPSLGSDPLAFLFFDSSGHFATQMMKRDRTSAIDSPASSAPTNNSRAQGGYDAYFGTYTLDEKTGTLTTDLVGALAIESVGQRFVRHVSVEDEVLTLELDTKTSAGEPVKRTVRWRRVG